MNMKKNHPLFLAGMFLLLAVLACNAPASTVPTAMPTAAGQAGEEASPAPTPTSTPTPSATDTPVPDVSGPGGCTLNSSWVADVTVPDNTEFPPGAAFTKTWRVRNSGTCAWETGTKLVFVSGDPLGGPAAVDVSPVAPGSSSDISVDLAAPADPGTYRGNWQLQAPDGTRFGSVIYVKIIVPAPATDTPEPTDEPTAEPTDEPTEEPTDEPTEEPTVETGPDLYISELSINPSNPQSGDTIHVRVGTYNQGSQAAGAYKVTFKYSPQSTGVCAWDVSSTAAHGGRILECDVVVYSDYTGLATTDVDGTIAETDESNNTSEIEIPVPEAVGVDLYISEMSVTPDSINAGDTVAARVGIYNRGNAAAGSFWVYWRYGIGDFDGCSWEIDSLVARGGRILTCEVEMYHSFDTVATADGTHVIAEAVETNNDRAFHVEVSP